ncbi:MAG: TIGR00341 family protein [Desulfobulbales bacterium]|nr:TIGR00341 family protein [Desulfobulbales bacterium]
MALRLLEIVIPEEHVSEVLSIIEREQIVNYWQTCSCESRVIFKLILPAEGTEKIMDEFEKRYSSTSDFHMALLSVEASFPSPREIEEKKEESKEPEQNGEKIPLRVSRQELYNEVFDNSKLTKTFVVMVILSTIVASIGLLKDNIAVVIGAMVIAPLLGPNVALSFAITLGDLVLGYNSLKTNLAGIAVAFAVAFLLGVFLNVNPDIPEIHARTFVGYDDIVLALASGIAGALSLTSGVPSTLIGVMVAVALIPPLVVFGLLLGGGYADVSFNALLLLIINMICINLAGVVTLLIKGVQPIYWWEASKAKRLTKYAIIVWVSLLLVLVLLLYVSSV